MFSEDQLKAMSTSKLYEYSKSVGVEHRGISRGDLVRALVAQQTPAGGSAAKAKAAPAAAPTTAPTKAARKTVAPPPPPVVEEEEESEEEEAPPPPPVKAARKAAIKTVKTAPPPEPEEEDASEEVFGDSDEEEVEEELPPPPPVAKKASKAKAAPIPVEADEDDDAPFVNPQAVVVSDDAILKMKLEPLKAFIRDLHKNDDIKSRAGTAKIDTNGSLEVLQKRTIDFLKKYKAPLAEEVQAKVEAGNWLIIGAGVLVDLEGEGKLPGKIVALSIKGGEKTADIELEDGGNADGVDWDTLEPHVIEVSKAKPKAVRRTA